ncbi:cytochrome P450 [Nemania sp. FL0916]|nr:cytochrome P450 [Nemania sp. FL0916]
MDTINPLRFIARLAAALLILWLTQVVYRGLSARIRFRRMKAQGLPVPNPHSFLFGHIPLMKSLKEGLPKDAHETYYYRKLTRNWRDYFPHEKERCPPVIYLDLWPLFSQPLILATSAEACHQLTQQTPQPRHSLMVWAITPVTGGKDLHSMDAATHRLWRSRLNPGFSPQNILSQVPILLEEVGIFAEQLKSKAGPNGDFGDFFTLFDRSVALTFDIIMKSALGLHTKEQTEGPSPVFHAFRHLITHIKLENLWNKLARLRPSYRQDVAANTKVLNDVLLPEIKSRLGAKGSRSKTVIDLAVRQSREEAVEKPLEQSGDFIDVALSQLKLFMLAGHDTTGQMMCWLFYELSREPAVLARLRAEHDDILGPDPDMAAQVVSDQPHKLNALSFTSAVIKETLRLHPIASTYRRGTATFGIEYEGTTYPAGNCMVITSPAAVHLRPDLWPRANEFLPERFLVAEDHPLRPVKHAWRPFELGSTRCIGEELAMVELKLALVLTMRELDFDFDYELWHELHHKTGTLDSVNGEHIYRVGNGMGSPKDNMPTRVKRRGS